jgi:hypothetical protein
MSDFVVVAPGAIEKASATCADDEFVTGGRVVISWQDRRQKPAEDKHAVLNKGLVQIYRS